MSRSSPRTPASRWLPGNIRIMGVKLVALTNAFRGFVEQFGIRHGPRSEKLRGPSFGLEPCKNATTWARAPPIPQFPILRAKSSVHRRHDARHPPELNNNYHLRTN